MAIIRALAIGISLYLLILARPGQAHEVRPALLTLDQVDATSYDVVWKLPARGDNMRLALTVEFPAGTIQLTKPKSRQVQQAAIDQWRIQVPQGLAGGSIKIHGLEGTMTDALVRIATRDGDVQVSRLTPANPQMQVRAQPSSLQVFKTYWILGNEHILLGIDHILFVLALLLIIQGWRTLALTITAFTLAHSLTLVLTTLNLVRLPIAPVEAVIALSIVLMAGENIRHQRGVPSFTYRYPWLVAGIFGLVHGAGFASALAEVGLPYGEIPMALLAFNLGVETGQLAFVASVSIAMHYGKHLWPSRSLHRRLLLFSSYAIGGVASFWLFERLAQY